ncbi:MAG: MATE family efflux transporter [Candidatus Omnitrophota bacterium]
MRLFSKKITALARESWAMSWPMILIMFFEFLIGLADVYVAGKVGKEIQAAYGLAFQLYFVGLIPAMALTAGTVSVVSKLFTAPQALKPSEHDAVIGENEELKETVFSSLASSTLMGVIVGALVIMLSSAIIGLLRVPAIIKNDSAALVRIYSLGFIFDYFLINANGILRACGKVKISLRNYTIICLLNIVLNFVLVFATPLGFSGIAIATVISVAVGALLNAVAVKNLLGAWRFRFRAFKEMVAIGWPIGLLQILWNLATVVIFSILGSLPSNNIELIAAFTNGLKVEAAIFLPAFAFNLANAVVVGNLLGKGKKDDAFKSGLVTAGLGMAIIVVLSLVVILQARNIMTFLSNNSIVVSQGFTYLYITFAFEPFMAWGVILAGGLAGAGHTKNILAVVALSLWIIKIPFCYLAGVVWGMGAVGMWWAMNLAIVFQAVLMSWYYFKKMRPVAKVIQVCST